MPVLILRPSNGFLRLDLSALWEYRELLYFLVWRDIKVRYKQTALGAAWAILQPVMTMIVFSVFFGRLAKVPSDGVPYPIFAYVGAAAVAALRLRPERIEQQPGGQPEPDHQSLFPAPGDSASPRCWPGWWTSPSPSSSCW